MLQIVYCTLQIAKCTLWIVCYKVVKLTSWQVSLLQSCKIAKFWVAKLRAYLETLKCVTHAACMCTHAYEQVAAKNVTLSNISFKHGHTNFNPMFNSWATSEKNLGDWLMR